VLFTLARGTEAQWDHAQIVVQSLKTGQRKVLVEGGSDARYLPSGHIVYALGGVLFAVPFNVQRLEVTGGPIPVVEGVRRTLFGGALFDVSKTGTLMLAAGPATGGTGSADLAWTDTSGGIEPLKLPPGQYETPRASPDGRFAAVANVDASGSHIGIVDLSGASSPRRLTFAGKNRYPVWSPDSTRLAFQSDREGDLAIYSQRADGSPPTERLTRPERGVEDIPESWSTDRVHLLLTSHKQGDYVLSTVSLPDTKIEPFGSVRSGKPINATFSPGGRWVAYGTDEAGSDIVFVQPFPATGAKYQVSSHGDAAHHPAWSPDGTKLFYIPGPGRFVSVTMTTKPAVSFSEPAPAPRGFTIGNAQTQPRNHDIAPDGRFLGVTTAGVSTATVAAQQLELVSNWAEELKARVPTK
jgi:Tol biopolymer transport system component